MNNTITYYGGKDYLEPYEKVVTIVCIMNGLRPHWAEVGDGEDLYKLVRGLTEMNESEAEAAITRAMQEGLITREVRTIKHEAGEAS